MNEKVNIGELTNYIKKNINDSIKNDVYLNYILLEKTISLSDKIKAYAFKCHMAQNLKDNLSLIFYSFKCFKLYITNYKNKELLDSDSFTIAKALLRVQLSLKKFYNLFAFFYINLCKQITSYLPKSDLPEYISINKMYDSNIKSDIFKDKKELFNNNEELLKKIKQIFEDENKEEKKENDNEEGKEETKDEKLNEESIFLIDKNWYENCNLFINELLKGKNINNFFDPEEVKKNWINGNKVTYKGIYCGPINNIDIIEYKDFWYDPQDKYTNVFIKNDLNEDNYITLPLSKYNILKDNFGIYDVFEIERKKEELHLIQMKILILSKFFYDRNKENYVRRRAIQISKKTTLQEFTNKITRVLDNFFNNNINNEEKIDFSNINLTIYTTNKKLEKFDILTIIYSYKENKSSNENKTTNENKSNKENKSNNENNSNNENKTTNENKTNNENVTNNEKVTNNENKTNNENISNKENNKNDENEPKYDLIIPSLKINIINSEEDFSSFLSNYNIKETEIIIEINPKDTKNTFFENTIKYQNIEELVCNKCHKTEKEKDKNSFRKCLRFQSCTVQYCSKKCSKKDKTHIKFHKSFNSILVEKFNIQTLLDSSVDDFLNSNSKHGLTGLMNLGNTCFMNSAIQCLSNCELLTTYFISGMYKSEINTNNKFGTGGLIVSCYFDLLDKLWVQDKSFIHPLNFKDLFGHFVKQFAGFSQQDSHEMLTFMLDNIHEDLNRNKEKKYVELNEQQPNETDEQASERWWNCNLSRDNSIIVDLFYGQFKSTVQCPVCDKSNINYDQFMCLGLPIPNNGLNGYAYVINNKSNNIRKIRFDIGENDTCEEITKKLNKDKKYVYIFCNDEKMYLCVLNERYQIYQLYKQAILQNHSPDCKIIIYEFDEDEIENKEPFYFIPMVNNKKYDPYILFFPRPFYFDKNDNVQKMYDTIKQYYYKYYKEENSNFSDDKIKLKIINNLTSCSRDHAPCDYCKREDCNNCDFKFNKDDTIETLLNSQSKKRNFLIYIEIPKNNFKNNDLNSIKLFDNYKDDEGRFNIGIDLYSCFNALSKKEKLDENNLWYCSKCKEHRQAIKQLQIYKLPRILIIQLKRFKNNGYFFNNKNSAEIDFPIYNLELSDYVVGNKENKKYSYELFAVNQHFGISIGGHYTALCKNGNSWYNYDDEDVREINPNRLVSSNAYLLFYKLKN
jgi:ubiquitin C-terminal hydrolase